MFFLLLTLQGGNKPSKNMDKEPSSKVPKHLPSFSFATLSIFKRNSDSHSPVSPSLTWGSPRFEASALSHPAAIFGKNSSLVCLSSFFQTGCNKIDKKKHARLASSKTSISTPTSVQQDFPLGAMRCDVGFRCHSGRPPWTAGRELSRSRTAEAQATTS